MTILEALARTDAADSWAHADHARVGDVLRIVPDDWSFGAREINSAALARIRVDAPPERFSSLLETDGFAPNVAIKVPFRRRRLDLAAVYRLPGVKAVSDPRLGLVIDVPAEAIDQLVATTIESEPIANPQVFR